MTSNPEIDVYTTTARVVHSSLSTLGTTLCVHLPIELLSFKWYGLALAVDLCVQTSPISSIFLIDAPHEG